MANQFEREYARLNDAQREAVDTIDGPLLVIAGPGTGKTQLLSLRVANILRKTDTLPGSVLCVTFTENGATNMRERLGRLVGDTASKVSITTFHSLGRSIIAAYPEYFYRGLIAQPADELTIYEILSELFTKLPHHHILSGYSSERGYAWLKSVRQFFSDAKTAGLKPSDIEAILASNQTFLETAEPALREAFTMPAGVKRFTIKHLDRFVQLAETIAALPETTSPNAFIPNLRTVCFEKLQHAISECEASGSTKAITAWRNEWLEKNHLNEFVMKEQRKLAMLKPAVELYKAYLYTMSERGLFDFDDMILDVISTLETHDELRFNLQEQYQYVLVDEFQDTNNAQMKLLRLLSDHPVHEGRPNIMAVGDDDQAIFRFQGAEVSNMLEFENEYTDTKVVVLKDNYRSVSPVLQVARQVILQGTDRLESRMPERINKELAAHFGAKHSRLELVEHSTPTAQHGWIAETIEKLHAEGIAYKNMAIIAPKHKYLEKVLPHLRQHHLPVWYERRENVLDMSHIRELLTMATVISHVAHQRFDEADALLPELLTFPFFDIKPLEIWQLALLVKNSRPHPTWLEAMQTAQSPKLRNLAEALVTLSAKSFESSVETLLDYLIGNEPITLEQGDYIVPFKTYYFNDAKLDESAAEYLHLLGAVRVLREQLRSYRPDMFLNVHDFVRFAQTYRDAGLMLLNTSPYVEQLDAVQVMTVYKSKGLEFDVVFVIDCLDDVWGPRARGDSRALPLPANMPIARAGTAEDDMLRLLYVALTRAKSHLFMSFAKQSDDGKLCSPLSYFAHESLTLLLPRRDETARSVRPATLVQTLEHAWHDHLLSVSSSDQKALLAERLARYQLNATHVLNFLDLPHGGPKKFLYQNLLQFPHAMNTNALYGDVMHKTIEFVHKQSKIAKTPNLKEAQEHFAQLLKSYRLDQTTHQKLLERGRAALAVVLKTAELFASDIESERDFSHEAVTIGDAIRLSGKIDALQPVGDKELLVIDYKTGKGFRSWQGKDDNEKSKIRNYRLQLAFYKLLVEHSKTYGGKYSVNTGRLVFVEPDRDTGEIISIDYEITDNDMTELVQLLKGIWGCIMELKWPDTAEYSLDYKGRLAFEEYFKGLSP